MILRCLITCFFTSQFLNGVVSQGACLNCVPVKDCQVYGNLTKAEQERWAADFTCTQPRLDTRTLYGFSPYAKRDFICCPRTNVELHNRGKLETFIAKSRSTKFTRSADMYEPMQKSNVGEKNQKQGLENVWLNSQEDKSEYLKNDDPKQYDEDYKESENEYDSKRTPNWQRRPNTRGFFNLPMQNQFGGNMFQNQFGGNPFQNQYGGNLFQNPYFMKNPNVRNPSSGVNNVRNPSSGVNKNVNSGKNLRGQCTGLTSFPPEPDSGCCGRDVSDADRIIGGQTTELEQFPWTVLLNSKFINGRSQAEFSCGGSLISARYVLTAAHCLYDAVARLSDVEVFLAEYDKRTFPRDCMISPGEGRRCVDNIAMHAEDVVLHPQYDDSRLQNDIALIRLRGTAPYTDFIRPICLPLINIDNPEFSNLPLSVAGWGRNGRYQSDVKQSTVVNLVPQRECTRHYPHLTRNHVCAAGHTGEDTCKGDSGGPLMTLHRGKYFVAGIVSGKRADSPCGSAVPSLYTNVYNYLNWIRSNIKN